MNVFKKDKMLRRELISGTALTALVIAAILVFNVILYVLTSFLELYFAPEAEDELVLSGATDSMFAEALSENRKIKISFCNTEDNLKGHDTGSYVYRTVNNFADRYPDFIEVEYINLVTMRNSKGELVDFEKYKTDEFGNEVAINRSSVIFESEYNHRVITDTYSTAGYADFFTLNSEGSLLAYNGEEYVASMISWVLKREHKIAYFTISHSEQFDATFASLLVSAGYYINVVNLREQAVPEDAGLLIISNPRNDFETSVEGSLVHTEMERLREYVNGGGMLYVSLDPYVKQLPVLEGFLQECGITVSRSTGKLADVVRDPVNAITTDGYTLVTEYADSQLGEAIKGTVDNYSAGRVILREACALDLLGNARPLLVSTGAAVCETGGEVTRDEGDFTVAAYSEVEGPGKKTAKIFVIPSIYLTVADSLVTNGYSNKDFVFALFEHFYSCDTLPYGCRAVLYNTDTIENLTMSAAYTYTAIVIAIPVALTAAGAIIIKKRKNR